MSLEDPQGQQEYSQKPEGKVAAHFRRRREARAEWDRLVGTELTTADLDALVSRGWSSRKLYKLQGDAAGLTDGKTERGRIAHKNSSTIAAYLRNRALSR